jgi:hypothetical protein
MTAALILEPRERIATRQLSAVRPEPTLIRLAREGDVASMRDLLDMTSDSVYAYAFNATHNSHEAQIVTANVLERLPRVLRRQRWDTLDTLNSQLMSIARAEVGVYNRRLARNDNRRDVRTWTRHAMLAATSIATIVYAGILAF